MKVLPYRFLFALPVIGLLITWNLAATAQPPQPPQPIPATDPGPGGAEELTRGPVHEAFGQPVVFDPQPGPIAPQQPPAPVEEIPPGEQPAGVNVNWIPGYWSWDDGQKQFLWISGFWRDVPPGRAWVPGYWNQVAQGFQWVTGYWSNLTAAQPADTQYLPEPPQSLEVGPQGAAPANQVWIPGVWIWQASRYSWRPGFWSTASADWVWMPDRYLWSPLGYIFIAGYWDYPLWKRGMLFAPVRFTAYRPGIIFTPRIALDTTYLGYSMFVRPVTGCYYFGDYYAANYLQGGYFPWFSYHNTRFGYDPMFAQADWVYGRQNINWEARLRDVYYQRRDNIAARPALLYRDYARGEAGRGESALLRPLGDFRNIKDLPYKMERVDAARLEAVRKHAQTVREFGAERSRLEVSRIKENGGAIALRAPVTVHLPVAPRFESGTARPIEPRGLPVHPTHPEVDLARKTRGASRATSASAANREGRSEAITKSGDPPPRAATPRRSVTPRFLAAYRRHCTEPACCASRSCGGCTRGPCHPAN